MDECKCECMSVCVCVCLYMLYTHIYVDMYVGAIVCEKWVWYVLKIVSQSY